MTQPCSGQATAQPCTMPSDNGPPRCGQRSTSANTSSSAVRNTAMANAKPGLRTCRAPRRGMSSRWPISIQRSPAISASRTQGAVLVRLGAGSALRPGIDLHHALRDDETRVQCPPLLGIGADALADVIDPDARDPWCGPLEIARLLAVELEEGTDMLEHLRLGGDADQRVANADLDPAITPDDDVVARLDADDADILDCRLGAVTRAAGDRELDLVRGPGAPAHLLDLDPEPGRILRPEPAPLTADAGLHRAQTLGVGVAGNQPCFVEVGPDRRKLLLLDPQQVDALTAGDLDGRDRVLLGGIGNRAQLARGRQTAPHPRYHGIGAVLLDVGVHPLVDKTRLRVVAVALRPGADEVIVQGGPTFLAAILGLPAECLAHRRDCRQPLGSDRMAHRVVAVLDAFAHRWVRVVRDRTAEIGQDRLDFAGALAA